MSIIEKSAELEEAVRFALTGVADPAVLRHIMDESCGFRQRFAENSAIESCRLNCSAKSATNEVRSRCFSGLEMGSRGARFRPSPRAAQRTFVGGSIRFWPPMFSLRKPATPLQRPRDGRSSHLPKVRFCLPISSPRYHNYGRPSPCCRRHFRSHPRFGFRSTTASTSRWPIGKAASY